MQALDSNTYLHKKLLDWKFPYTQNNHRFTNEKTLDAYTHLNCMDNHAIDISHKILIAGKMVSQTLLRETNEERWHNYHSLQETRFYDYTLQFQYYD